MRILAATASLGLIASGCATPKSLGTIGSVERLAPSMDDLVPKGAEIQVIATGFEWSEGPLWVGGEDGFLLFSDIPPNRVWKWNANEGTSIYLAQSGYLGSLPRPGFVAPDEPGSNGLLLDPEGRLILCQHGLRQMGRMSAPLNAPQADYETVAARWNGRRFNSPNDAIFHSNGDLYFTDPPYGLTGKMEDPEKEIDFQGVYRVTPEGDVTLLTDEMSRPNGIAFSPDERTLYVANSDPKRALWMAFPVHGDGTIGEGRVLFDATSMVPDLPGLPDGLAVDTEGNLFATGPGGVLVLDPGGRHLGTILTGRPTSNCTFGGAGNTLYITADEVVARVRVSAFGVRQ